MEFRYYSDLHGNMPDSECDTDKEQVCILAGDVVDNWGSKGAKFAEIVEKLSNRFLHVVWVAGNHEYYNTSMVRLYPKVREVTEHLPNFTALQNAEHIDFGNTRVIGATMWSDTSKIAYNAETGMNDYRYIRTGTLYSPYYKKLKPMHTSAEHCKHVGLISKAIKAVPEGMSSIVVTHHAPSTKSVARRFEGHPLNDAYVTDIELDQWPDYWIHGHIHQAVEYEHNGCIVCCNPHGYGTEHTDFEPLKNKIITQG